MRIVQLIHSLAPERGGPPVVALRLAEAQARLGHDVRLLSCVGGDFPGRDRLRAQLVQLPLSTGAGQLLPWPALRQLLPHLRGCDVLHLHEIWQPLLLQTALLARGLGKPYAVTLHGMLTPWCLSHKKLKKNLGMRLGFRGMLQHAALLHALNHHEAESLLPLGLRPAVRIVPNGVFAEEFESLPSPGTFRRLFPELGTQPFVFFLGRLHPVKGLDHLAAAFALAAARRPELRLVVAGPDEGDRDRFLRQVQELGLASRTHCVGPLYGPDKLAAMVDAACLCQPSRTEGFSMTLIEALVCGLPLVISEQCHFPEVAEAGAGEVVPLQPQALAAALLRLLDSEQQRREMGRRGRELVLGRYTWPRIAGQMIECYRECLERG